MTGCVLEKCILGVVVQTSCIFDVSPQNQIFSNFFSSAQSRHTNTLTGRSVFKYLKEIFHLVRHEKFSQFILQGTRAGEQNQTDGVYREHLAVEPRGTAEISLLYPDDGTFCRNTR